MAKTRPMTLEARAERAYSAIRCFCDDRPFGIKAITNELEGALYDAYAEHLLSELGKCDLAFKQWRAERAK